MYSFKEKIRILKELLNPASGEADLVLLCRLSPEDPLIPAAQISPSRNAEAILFKLLDLTTREEIRLNRRNFGGYSVELPQENISIPETTENVEKQGYSLQTKEKKSTKKNKSIRISGGKSSVKTKTSK